MKDMIKGALRKFGLELNKIGTFCDSCSYRETGPYTLFAPYAVKSYTPWYEDWFKKIIEPVKDVTVCVVERCYMVDRFSLQAAHLPGDFAECGVYRGGTAYLIASSIKRAGTDKTLRLFDTFHGMPEEANRDPSWLSKGDFSDSSPEKVRALLSNFSNITLFPGLIPETFKGLEEKTYAFVHIDVDLYETTHACLDYFYPRMVPGGIFLFDDYGSDDFIESERKAADEFFAAKDEVMITLRTGQGLVLKL